MSTESATAPIDIREVSGCTCLRLRRTARQVTQIYDHALEPAKLTANQFGLLAYLYGVAGAGKGDGLPVGVLAERTGVDSTTLSRNLKLIEEQQLAVSSADPDDRRVRVVRITEAGAARLREAVPRWRQAQAKVEEALGLQATLSLNGLLDLCSAKLTG
jgi:DNA-binding MarR family transcriptional regulator